MHQPGSFPPLPSQVRDEEVEEMQGLLDACVLHPVKGGVENVYGKVNILLQTYISQLPLRSFSLVSDMNYVAQNAGRLLRALFEMALRRNLASMSAKLLTLCKCVDHQLWWSLGSPLRQVW
jgi:activating signal cointegrator complex subunit 3